MMGLLDRVKAGAEQAASTAQRQAQIVAAKRELSQATTISARPCTGSSSAARSRTAISPQASTTSASCRRD